MNNPLLFAAAIVLACSSCRAVKSQGSDVEVAGATGYVFRGLQMNDGYGVETQGRIIFNRADGSSVSGYAWGYFDGSGDPPDGALETTNSGRFSRLDIGVQWTRSFEKFGLSAGVASYNFPNTPIAATSEAFVAGELTTTWLRPGAVFYYDMQNAKDLYLRVGAHPKFQLDRALTADFGLDVGYMGGDQARFYYGVNSSGLSDLLLTGGLTYRQSEYFRAFARVGYSKVLNSALESRVTERGLDSEIPWLSIGCGWSY